MALDYKISLIVPTYNRADLLEKTIKNLQNQTYTNWEMVVVDDGSIDKTSELVAECSKGDLRIKYIKRGNDRKKGANTCRNIGLELSKGEYIKWIDSDDYLGVNCLEKQIAAIETDNADVCFCRTQFFWEKEGDIVYSDKQWSKMLSAHNLTKSLIIGELRWHTMSGLWRKAYFKENPFFEGLMNSQEWLFHIKISLLKTSYCFLNEVLTYARVHSGSMSNNSNKGSNYYYHAAFARYLAFKEISNSKISLSQKVKAKLLKKFIWFHFFVLYKKGLLDFTLLFRFYPKIFKVVLWK